LYGSGYGNAGYPSNEMPYSGPHQKVGTSAEEFDQFMKQASAMAGPIAT